jgi:hypothetical protein
VNRKAILKLIRSTPPRCLRGFQAKRVPVPAKGDHDLVTAWKLVCPCGSSEGTVLGHPLAKLQPGSEDDPMFVSPFSFRCSRCRKQARFLDTDADGAGAELAKLEGSDVGCAAYRGKGRGQPFPCPKCGASRGEVVVALSFHEDYLYELEEDGIAFPFENLFSGVHVYSRCSGCGKQTMVTDLDTKY